MIKITFPFIICMDFSQSLARTITWANRITNGQYIASRWSDSNRKLFTTHSLGGFAFSYIEVFQRFQLS